MVGVLGQCFYLHCGVRFRPPINTERHLYINEGVR